EPSRPPALALRVPGDHELLPTVGLDLQPLAGALSLAVGAIGTLGDDPLETLRPGRLVERVPVLERLRQPHRPVPAVEDALQPLAALAQRQVDERLTLQLEHIECLVDDRSARLALLHRREARAALLVERAHLAVEHG